MPIGIQHALRHEDTIGRDEVFDESWIDGAAGRRWRLRGSGTLFDPGSEH